jgi:hypothetical protein
MRSLELQTLLPSAAPVFRCPWSLPEQESHAPFLCALNALGGFTGNGRLQELLEWDEATYHQVKAPLVASRYIVTGRGQGGSVDLASLNGGGCHVPVEAVAGTSTANSVGVAAASSPNGSSGMSTPQSSPPHPPQPRRTPVGRPPSPLPTVLQLQKRSAPPDSWRRASERRRTNLVQLQPEAPDYLGADTGADLPTPRGGAFPQAVVCVGGDGKQRAASQPPGETGRLSRRCGAVSGGGGPHRVAAEATGRRRRRLPGERRLAPDRAAQQSAGGRFAQVLQRIH